jgi:hypothetical protein
MSAAVVMVLVCLCHGICRHSTSTSTSTSNYSGHPWCCKGSCRCPQRSLASSSVWRLASPEAWRALGICMATG